jgi:mono/diheme cytochrome c family protein
MGQNEGSVGEWLGRMGQIRATKGRNAGWLALVVVSVLGSSAARAAGDATKGGVVYQANCAACHGKEANGAGPAAAALRPKPTNFTDSAFWSGKDDARVRSMIKTGKPGTAMMPFPGLSAQDLDDLVAFLRTKAPAAPTP